MAKPLAPKRAGHDGRAAVVVGLDAFGTITAAGGRGQPMAWSVRTPLLRDVIPVGKTAGLEPLEWEPVEAEPRLDDRAFSVASIDSSDLTVLARYVAGADSDLPVGVTVQQVIGRLFHPTYAASKESYDAAEVIASLLSARPLTALRTLWWTWSGRLDTSRQILWGLARDDRRCIRATALAVHDVVDTVRRMREAARDPRGLGREPPAEVVARCGGNSLALTRQGSDCPARGIVPRLLEEVWIRAVKEHAQLRYGRRRRSLLALLLGRGFAILNAYVPWYGLPNWVPFRQWIEIANLRALYEDLRAQNLYDTRTLAPCSEDPLPSRPTVLHWRTADGSFNDLADPAMGQAGTPFGRSVPLEFTRARELPGEPDPRVISRRLLGRETFIPALSLNLLAGAWIQFQVNDWFGYADADPMKPFNIDFEDGDDRLALRPMPVPDRGRHPRRSSDSPTFINRVTQWWDASQIYGSDDRTQWSVRSGLDGKLALENALLPRHPVTGIEVTGYNQDWWVGLSVLHHLFTLEHNAICDRLRQAYRAWSDEQLFQVARLVNAALIAKIHTLEWTLAILAHPTVKIAMDATWWGLAGEWVKTHVGRLADSEAISGIPGSATDHHSAPYAVPEEFVSVCRMYRALMPDEVTLHRLAGDGGAERFALNELIGRHARAVVGRFSMTNVLYSLGIANSGKLTLGNYPRPVQESAVDAGHVVDLAAVELVRDRERGVPRYNELRRLLRMKPVRSFHELNPQWAGRLRDVYGTEKGRDRVDLLDLIVGLFAETPPPGFGFGDTAFRIFMLMASRRLKSDRFFTVEYTPTVYTRIGLDWIDDNDMRTVLLRHYPALAPAIIDVRNGFAPWRRIH
jgi:hypothetical protein